MVVQIGQELRGELIPEEVLEIVETHNGYVALGRQAVPGRPRVHRAAFVEAIQDRDDMLGGEIERHQEDGSADSANTSPDGSTSALAWMLITPSVPDASGSGDR